MFDRQRFREICDGDEAAVHKLVRMALLLNEDQLGRLRDAVRTSDLVATRSLVHELRRNTMTVGADGLTALAAQILQYAGRGDWEQAGVAAEQFGHSHGELAREMAQFRPRGSDPSA